MTLPSSPNQRVAEPSPTTTKALGKQDAHAFGCTPFNAGTTITVRSDAAHRGANPAKRIISEVEVSLPICAAPSRRDRVLFEVV